MSANKSLRPKFSKGESVLCYEPDPNKIQLLYDAKIVEIILFKKNRSVKKIDYLIHFAGWRSSWDRLVPEEFILKDTEENRTIQKKLADESQLIIDHFSYRRPKGSKKVHSNINNHDSNDSSKSMKSNMDSTTDYQINCNGFINDYLSNILELDYYFINSDHMILKLPMKPNVIEILETYYKNYLGREIDKFNKRQLSARQVLSGIKQLSTESRFNTMINNIRLCKEVLDGLRISFDFYLTENLLYEREKLQTLDLVPAFYDISTENNSVSRKKTKTTKIRLPPKYYRNNKIKDKLILVSESQQPEMQSAFCNEFLNFTLLPPYVYDQIPPPSSLVYGAVHLCRLFIKLPEIMVGNISMKRSKIIRKYIDDIAQFLSINDQWFDQKIYVKNV